MGIRQNLRLWENRVTYIDEDGVVTSAIRPRQLPPAPWKLIGLLTWKNWMYFLVGLSAWTADGYDFNAVNLVTTQLSARYSRSLTDITLSITLTLLFRPLGACMFGMLSDMFGRKWPLAINLWILAVLQVGTAFAPTYEAFIGVRALFGVAMGGIWGLSAAMSLENMPVEARGLFSGVLQQGYSIGYLIAAIINLTLVPATAEGYKGIFHFGAGFTALIAAVVMLIPESHIYASKEGEEKIRFGKRIGNFVKDLKLASRQYWRMFLYCVVLSMFFNWMSHGSQDMYVTYLKVQKEFSNSNASICTIIGQCGAVFGGLVVGYYNQFVGRRLTVVIACCFGLTMIPLWTLPTTMGPIAVGTFFIQTANNGAWGVMPILLNEYAPPQFRGVFPGTVYQLGNMLSAPAAQIQTVSASNWIKNGKPNYSQVMTIVMCIIFVSVAVVTACGQERTGSHFEVVERAGAQHNIGGKVMEDEETPIESKQEVSHLEQTPREKSISQ